MVAPYGCGTAGLRTLQRALQIEAPGAAPSQALQERERSCPRLKLHWRCYSHLAIRGFGENPTTEILNRTQGKRESLISYPLGQLHFRPYAIRYSA
jgi:hypothetical protein